jgi:hypothetical protein
MTYLEKIETPDSDIIKATDLVKLLRSLMKVNQMAWHGEYGFRQRAKDLANRWGKLNHQRRANS